MRVVITWSKVDDQEYLHLLGSRKPGVVVVVIDLFLAASCLRIDLLSFCVCMHTQTSIYVERFVQYAGHRYVLHFQPVSPRRRPLKQAYTSIAAWGGISFWIPGP